MNIDIATAFKSNRKRLGKTQGQMADLLLISRHNISAWEEGRACPRVTELIRISRKLGYSTVEEFLDLESTPYGGDNVVKAYNELNPEKKKIVDFILKLK